MIQNRQLMKKNNQKRAERPKMMTETKKIPQRLTEPSQNNTQNAKTHYDSNDTNDSQWEENYHKHT